MQVNEVSSSSLGVAHISYLCDIKNVDPIVRERMNRKPYHSFTGKDLMGEYTKFMKGWNEKKYGCNTERIC